MVEKDPRLLNTIVPETVTQDLENKWLVAGSSPERVTINPRTFCKNSYISIGSILIHQGCLEHLALAQMEKIL